MKIPRNIGMILLAIYLIVAGLTQLFDMDLGQLHVVLPILALAAGVLILIGK